MLNVVICFTLVLVLDWCFVGLAFSFEISEFLKCVRNMLVFKDS